MTTVRRALGFSFLSQYLLQVIQFVVIMVISRLLTPSEVGVFSVAAVSLFLANELKNFGVSQYLVRAEVLTPARMASARGMAFITSWTIALAFLLGARAIASFFEEPGLELVYQVVALNFFILPLLIVPHAYLVRTMAFDRILIVSLVGTVVRGVVSIGLAFLDFGYMSLAWGYLLGGVGEVIATLALRKDTSNAISFRGLSEIFAFGFWNTAASVLGKGYEGIPDLLLGKLSTMESVGIFSRGMSLVLIFQRLVTKAVSRVVFPYFSQELREGNSIKPGYIKAVSMQTALAWPFFAALYFLAEPMLLLLFGSQWTSAAPVTQALCFWGAIYSLYSFADRVIVATGRIKLFFAQQALVLLARGTAIVIAVPFGLPGVGVAVSAVGLFELGVSSLIVRRLIDTTLGEVLLSTLPSWLPTVGCGLVAWAGMNLLAPYAPSWELRFALCLVLGPLTWLAWVFMTRQPIAEELRNLAARARALLMG